MSHEVHPQAPGRTAPHSIEAEEYVLSSCLLDDNDTIASCRRKKLEPAAFFKPANRLVFEKLCELHEKGIGIDLAVLAEELKTTKQLDEVGGYAFLEQISRRVSTSANLYYFLEKLRELQVLRELITASSSIIEKCYNSHEGREEFVSSVRDEFDAICDRATLADGDMSTVNFTIDAMLAFKPDKDPNTLLGKRYLCRTQQLLLISQSGVGKSVASMQAGIMWSLGRDFFGIKPVRPLRILYVQAENDLGDASEAFQGIVEHFGLTAGDQNALALMRQNFRVRRFSKETGAAFIARLRKENRDFNADIVIADPLLSFLGADASDQRAVTEFLRCQVNDFLLKSGAAMAFVHHTGKPPIHQKKGRSDVDKSYAGIGTSELTNWARAVIVVEKESLDRPIFRMTLTKRGGRAGVVDEHGQKVTQIFVEHAPHTICWLPSDYKPGTNGKSTQFKKKYSLEEMIRLYEPNYDWADNRARISAALGCDPKTVDRRREEITRAS